MSCLTAAASVVGDRRDVPAAPPLLPGHRQLPPARPGPARRLPRLLRLRRARPRRPQRHRRRLPLCRRGILPPGDAEAPLRGRQGRYNTLVVRLQYLDLQSETSLI